MMDAIWNEVNFKMPPLITLQVSDASFVKQVRSILLETKSQLNDRLQDEFANCAALLSRLMARRKNSFHNMSGFKLICKLNSALSRLLKVGVEEAVNNFFQMLPDVYSSSHNQVPSRNSLEYVLLRIISVHKLYQRIAFCCIESANYFSKLLRNNFFMETITLFLAVIAKINDLANKLGNTYSDLYRELIKMRKSFPPKDSNNHFNNFEFPNQLDRFTIYAIDKMDTSAHSEDRITMHKQTVQSTPVPSVSVLSKVQKLQDIGMPISRESMKPMIDLSRIHNVDDIHQFFKKEDEERKKSLNSCATKYILKHEWLAIQKLVERKIIANDHKKALSIFRKFITSKV